MKTIDWDSLTFANNYVFQEVLKNKKICKYLIERILHIQIKDIRYLVAERHINSARISSKSIRLDVYVENQEGTVLDIEMQVTGDNSTVYFGKDEATVIKGLPLRTRYYQSLISMDMLKQGMKYRELRKSYVNSGKTGSEFTRAIDAETKRVTNDEEWRERYVTWEMDLKIIQEDAEKKGRLAGQKEKALAIAKALKEDGMADEKIAKVTDLPLPVVAAL